MFKIIIYVLFKHSKKGMRFIMLEKFLKKSSWTDIAVSLIFILFGAMLMMSPETVQAMIAILLGAVFIAMGIFRLINYIASGKTDRYSLSIGIVAIITGIIIMFCSWNHFICI